MSQQRIEMIFKEDSNAGQTALRFWMGVAVLSALAYMWWHGWFSSVACELNVAPESLEESFRAREVALQSTGHEPVGSTGALSILFDTVCLIGLGSFTVWGLMWKVVRLAYNGASHIVQGLYARADRDLEVETEKASVEEQIEHLHETIRTALVNHETRLQLLEPSEDIGIVIPKKEPEPIPAEEIIDELQGKNDELESRVAELQKVIDDAKARSRAKRQTNKDV